DRPPQSMAYSPMAALPCQVSLSWILTMTRPTIIALFTLSLCVACTPTGGGPAEQEKEGDGDGDGDGDVFLPGDGDGDVTIIPMPNSNAFPAEPILEPGVDSAAIAVFENPDDFAPGVCVYEPHLSDDRGVGALYP